MKVEQALSGMKDGFRRLLQPLVRTIAESHLHPNTLTFSSFIFSVSAALAFAVGHIRIAALLLLIAGLLDVLDGGVARASNRVTRFGALFDSVLDRYSESVVFVGIGYFFLNSGGLDAESKRLLLLVISIAMVGSLIVSYVRARAEGLGFECSVGLFQRPERLVTVSIGALISPKALIVVLAIIAVMANYSALQRMYHVWKMEGSTRYESASPNVSSHNLS